MLFLSSLSESRERCGGQIFGFLSIYSDTGDFVASLLLRGSKSKSKQQMQVSRSVVEAVGGPIQRGENTIREAGF